MMFLLQKYKCIENHYYLDVLAIDLFLRTSLEYIYRILILETMNESTLKILIALGFANIAMTTSSEAGKKIKKSLEQKIDGSDSEEENSVLDKKSGKNFAPVSEEKAPVEKKAPVSEEKAPVEKKDPVSEEKAPVEKKAPVSEEKAPVEKKAPVSEEKAPVEKKAPVSEEKAPVEKKAPVSEEKAPVEKKAPVSEEKAPVEKKAPVSEEKAPIIRKNQENHLQFLWKNHVPSEAPVEKKAPVSEEKAPVVAANEAREESNSAPQQEPAPSAQMTEEKIEEIFEELGRIKNEAKNADMLAGVILFIRNLIPDSIFSSDQKAKLDEVIQLSLKPLTGHDVIAKKQALLVSVKAEKNFYELECQNHATILEAQIKELTQTTTELNTRESLSWHVDRIKKLEKDKNDNQKLIQENEEKHAKANEALKKCTKEEDEKIYSIVRDERDAEIKKCKKIDEDLKNDIKAASELKETFIRVTDNEKQLNVLEFQIKAAKSEDEKTRLTDKQNKLKKMIEDDTKNAYYQNLENLKIKKIEEETKKTLAEKKLQNSIEKKELITNRINFYELEWGEYLKCLKEEAEKEQNIKAVLEAEVAFSKKQAQEISNLQLRQSNLQKENKGLSEELHIWKSNKKKRSIFSKINPFKFFKRKHKNTEE
jgi:hypothetical protein